LVVVGSGAVSLLISFDAWPVEWWNLSHKGIGRRYRALAARALRMARVALGPEGLGLVKALDLC